MIHLRFIVVFLFVLSSSLYNTACLADKGDQVIGVSPGITELHVYADLKANTVPTKLLLKEVKFPLTIIEEGGDFLRVRLGVREVWLDGSEVSISKPTTYACDKQSAKPVMVGSTQGASTGCK